MKIIYLMLLMFSMSVFAKNKIDNLIIFKVISKKDISKSQIDMINTSIESNLTSYGYGIINENIQNEALEEQKKQQNSDCYDDQCLVDTGRMLSAKKLLIVRISNNGENNFFIKVRKIDIESGIIENTFASSKNLNFDNYENLNSIVNNLLKKVIITEKTVLKKPVSKKSTLQKPVFYKSVKYNKKNIVKPKKSKEIIGIGTIELIAEYKLFTNISYLEKNHFHTGIMMGLLTMQFENIKFDFIRFGFLTDFKSSNSLKDMKFSFMNIEVISDENIYYSLMLGYMFGDGDIMFHDDYTLITPLGIKIGYRMIMFKDKLLAKFYSKVDWLIFAEKHGILKNGMSFTLGASLEYFF